MRASDYPFSPTNSTQCISHTKVLELVVPYNLVSCQPLVHASPADAIARAYGNCSFRESFRLLVISSGEVFPDLKSLVKVAFHFRLKSGERRFCFQNKA